jgi:hypothetical protein
VEKEWRKYPQSGKLKILLKRKDISKYSTIYKQLEKA